jgi:hypothetical protein
MNKIISISLLLLFVISSFQCKKDTSKSSAMSIEDMLVKNNEITGWAYSGAGWVASSGSELTHYIDGGSELFIKHGFIEASNQVYEGNVNNYKAQLTARVLNQGNIDNAVALFEDPDLQLSSALVWSESPAGTEARYFRFQLSQLMYFYRSKYVVMITIDNDSEESLSIIKQFAYNVDAKIKSALK